MPPKIKITKKDIIEISLELIRRNGTDALNARNIASALGCSTQPIFSNFKDMEELQKEITLATYQRYLRFIEDEIKSGKYPQYKSFGMAYIRFAKDDRELFRLLFMCDRENKDFIPTDDFDTSVEIIMNANGITREKAELIHLEMWAFVHGIATMFATSFLSLEWELISDMVTDVYQGIRTRHLTEDKL